MQRPIVVNARAAARPELGGVERWARETAARLPTLRPGAYVVVRPPAALAHRAGHAWEQLALPARAARLRASLVLSPANLAPLAWPRNAVVVHDAAALRHPEWYSRAYAAWHRALLPRIARRARLLITVSSFSRRELVELLAVDERSVVVVPGGVDERFSPGAGAERAAVRLQLGRPYVLTVGSLIARKNLDALSLAAARLRAQGIELVVAGGGRPHLRAEAQAAGVRALGPVPDELLPGLYAGARAFALPSRYEGFGLTCLEAMASGVPVVASDRGALPETCGEAALLVDPDDGEEVAAALERAVGDEAVRERLIAAGRARAGELTWERTAREVDALLAQAAGRERAR